MTDVLTTREVLSLERLSANGVHAHPDERLTIDAADLLSRPYVPPQYLIEHLVPERSVILLSADTGAGKTSFLLHAAISYCLGHPVAGRFGSNFNGRPVLYINGEMTEETLRNYLHANIAGCGIDVADFPRDRVHFHGRDGMSSFMLLAGEDATAARDLEDLIARLRPGIVIFDTLRALFDLDESKAQDVRRIITWLGTLRSRFDVSVAVAHHVRKLSQVSNGARERVSGSRDLVAGVDVHLAMRSNGGRPVGALLLDKTRSRLDGLAAGTEWPIEARWIDAERPRSTFVAGEPTDAGDSSSAIEAASQEILDQLASEPRTREQLGVIGGSPRRAFERLLKARQVVPDGKSGRKQLYSLATSAEGDA